MKLRLVFSFLSSQRKDNDNRLCFFYGSKNVEWWVFYFLCLTCYKASLCYNATNELTRTQMAGDSAPTQQKNLASGKNQERFCALAVCKTLRDFPDDTGWLSVVECWSVVCVMSRIAQSQRCRRWFAEEMPEIDVRRRKAKRIQELKLLETLSPTYLMPRL